MASARPLTALARTRLLSQPVIQSPARRLSSPAATAAFSTSACRTATPAGPPPAGFRLPRPKRWDESSESTLDKAGRYFLLTEMLRGMYVVLEQFFRPPYVPRVQQRLVAQDPLTQALLPATRSTTPSRRAPYRPASGASTPCDATPPARSGALHASSAKPYALRWRSRSKPKSGKMAAGGRRDMIST
jgi:hypothetical protein